MVNEANRAATHPAAEARRDAGHANEYRFNSGLPDYSLAAELADHLAEQEAEDERAEAEARREIYFMLELSGY